MPLHAPVTFAGYTPQTYGANLNGRSGAHAICDAAFDGSHFCTDWELDRSTPPPVAVGAWADYGTSQPSSRFFRATYSTTDTATCGGWTSSSPTVKPDGGNLGRGTHEDAGMGRLFPRRLVATLWAPTV